MEVKAGYKQTEVGIIPEDWDVKPLDTISFVTSGKRLPLGKSLVNSETSHPYIRITDMRMGTVSTSDLKFVPVDVFPAIKRYRIFKDDIFISVAGTLGIVGKIPLELDGANLTENADRITNITCSRDYLLHFLMSPTIQNTIEAIQTVGAQPKLALTRIRKFDIPVPPTLAEQEAIAEAFSDADALIEALEKLIAKKRQVKQGAMSKLLTGRKRLPGFSGKWKETRLGDIAEITKLAGFEYSKYFNSYKDGGDIIVIRGTNITNNRLDLSDIKTIPQSTSDFLQRSKLQKGDLVFAYVGTIGPVYLITESNKYHLGPNTARITVKGDNSPNFVFWYFCSSLAKKEIEERISVGAQPSLSMTKIRNFKISLPTHSEQTVIAEILSDMDAEIAALEGKLSKARQVKQGMMQELLTGRVRLV